MKIRHTLVGIALDIPDYLGVGAIPLLGDVLDVIGAIYFYRVLGPLGLASAIELVPIGLDFLPTNIVLGILADRRGGKKAE